MIQALWSQGKQAGVSKTQRYFEREHLPSKSVTNDLLHEVILNDLSQKTNDMECQGNQPYNRQISHKTTGTPGQKLGFSPTIRTLILIQVLFNLNFPKPQSSITPIITVFSPLSIPKSCPFVPIYVTLRFFNKCCFVCP